MGVYIKGMEMPKSCEDCPLENCDENYYGDESNHRCSLIYKGYTSNNRYDKRRDDCPLVPVPPHGDLIDRDKCEALSWKADEVEDSFDAGVLFALEHIDEMPTIIPAEPEEEGEA